MADKKPEKEDRPCIRCGHVGGKDDQFCIRCAAPLVNRCTDDRGLLSKGCSKVNPPEAAFCRFCGQPTVFHKQGLIKPFLGD